jgi:hypothetical protein
MSFTLLPGSHVDHVSAEVLAFVLRRFADRTVHFVETFELPAELGLVTNGLCGPICGDTPIREEEVYYASRPGRAYLSRLIDRAPRLTNVLTVIGGPGKDRATGQEYDCVLYTCFGGPFAGKEINDPRLEDHERAAAEAFWAEHALAQPR